MIPEIYFKISVFVLAILFFGIRIRFTSHFKFSRRMFLRLLFIVLILTLYFTSIVSFADMNIDSRIRFFDGGFLILISLLIFYLSHKVLGKNWTPIIDANKANTNVTNIVKTGPYRFLRHPIYSATFILLLGFWIFVSNWILGGIPFLLFSWIYLTKIDKEEKRLIKKFGKEYKNYMKNTWRLFPKLI